jgi:hypothetical protein
MSSKIIKKHLEKLKTAKKNDGDFIDILYQSNETNEGGDVTADKIVAVINKRYVEDQENTTKRI